MIKYCGVYVVLSLCVALIGNAQVKPELKLIENKSQWPSSVDYAARVPGGRLFLSPGQFSIYLTDQEKIEHDHHHSNGVVNESDGSRVSTDEYIQNHLIQIDFLNANLSASPQAYHRSTEYYNYFLGSDSSRWASQVYAYAEVIYPSLYAGVDLKVTSVGENLKYDLVVQPGGDPDQIVVEYCGADALVLSNGNLVIATSLGTITEKKPYSYQYIDGIKREVTSTYRLEENKVTFHFPEGYDPCYELVIDPLLIFSTFSGSTADNWGSTATPGENGTLYSSGITNHLNVGGTFPATPGAFQTTYGGNYDIAVLKYDSTGSEMLYASYLGGSSNETPHSLVMDSVSHDLIVLGTTSSSNFPVTAGALDQTFNGGTGLATFVISFPFGSDITLSRINSQGNVLLHSTFLGGTSNDGVNPAGPLVKNYGDDMRGDVITDANGDIYVSSVTSSPDFPALNSFSTAYRGGATDGALLKIKGDLSEIYWSAFVGGSGHDACHTLKFDANDNVYAAGGTTSANFPVTPGTYQTGLSGDADGWIARVQSDGSTVLQATFTGTVSFDQVYFVDLNRDGEIYVYGQTSGTMPVTPGVYNNPNSGQFVQKFTPELSSLIFSTVFGSGIGIPNISPTAFLVNDCNNLYMSGWGGNINISRGYWIGSSTHNMPITPDALQSTTRGSDFYFIVLTDDASELLYATYLGGNQSSIHVDGGTSRFDKSGIVYHAVCAGCGGGFDDFPTTPGAWSNTNNSGNCNNAAFKFDLSSLRARLQTNSVKFDAPGLDKLCTYDTIRFQNFSTGGEFYEWDLGDGTKLTKFDTTSFVHKYLDEGTYLVKLKAIDQNTCTGIDSVAKVINVFRNNSAAQDDDAICFGTTYTLQATGGVSYTWFTEEDGMLPSNVVTPEDTTEYFVTITDANGCVLTDSVQLDVVPDIKVKMEYELVVDCFSRPSIRVKNDSKEETGDIFFFDFGDSFISDSPEATHGYEADGNYTIRLVGVKEFCVKEVSVEIPFYTILVPNVITPEGSEGENDFFVIQYGEAGQTPADAGLTVEVKIINRWGRKVYESTDYKNDWAAKDVEAGIYYYHVTIGNQATCKSWIHVLK